MNLDHLHPCIPFISFSSPIQTQLQAIEIISSVIMSAKIWPPISQDELIREEEKSLVRNPPLLPPSPFRGQCPY